MYKVNATWSVTCIRSMPSYTSTKYSFSLAVYHVGHKMLPQMACVCSCLLLPSVTFTWLCKAGLHFRLYLTSTTKGDGSEKDIALISTLD